MPFYIIGSFVFVSIALSVTLILYLRMYNRRQRDLEAAWQEAVKYADAKSAFLANMSHELRTPINVMLGMNEMILRESDSDTIKSYGLNIKDTGKTLLFLINNILDVSRIESGKLEVIEERYQTTDLIGDLSLTGAELVGKKGIRFEVEADESLPRMLSGDFIHIKQVVANFLSNAAKYTKTGSVTLAFSSKTGERPDAFLLRISVTDTGIGIKQENIPFLFDAFTRVDLPANRNIEGTGLGLAIAKQLTELMGGKIHVASVWDKGSAFSVELPQKICDAAPIGKNPDLAASKENPAREGSFIAPGCGVLVVDDNRENRHVIRLLLARTMLRVDTAESGEECLEAVRSKRYDVILMDYMMPGMDGIKTLSELRNIPGFDTPVVALTANVMADTRQSLLDAGFCEYLSKPVMWRDLEAALLAVLPGEYVTGSTVRSGDILSDEVKGELRRELSNYSVALDDGLRYLGGDLLQYGKLATLFEKNCEEGMEEIRALAEERGFKRMKYFVHSLKSKARAVGANNLSASAAKLEGLCESEDSAYISILLPVLYHEWRRTRDGMAVLAARLKDILPEETQTDEPHAGLDALRALLRYNRQPDALETLERLMATAVTPEETGVLREIWRKVDNVEFREAERLLSALMGGVTV
ncbi:MAG: response regulator [Oscillospiraceae bacterium]|nr:response regulator [Oscillospiraceae bacterium]